MVQASAPPIIPNLKCICFERLTYKGLEYKQWLLPLNGINGNLVPCVLHVLYTESENYYSCSIAPIVWGGGGAHSPSSIAPTVAGGGGGLIVLLPPHNPGEGGGGGGGGVDSSIAPIVGGHGV